MGRQSFLWIVNATSKALSLQEQDSNQLSYWQFQTVKSDSRSLVFIKICDEGSELTDQSSGNAHFEAGAASFDLQFRVLSDYGPFLQVNWKGTDMSRFTVFPPPALDDGSQTGKLGWVDDGTLCLFIHKKGLACKMRDVNSLSPQPPLYTTREDYSVDGRFSAVLESFPPWMEYYSDAIGKLTLTEATLPCAHDSASSDGAILVSEPWMVTQTLSIYDQLRYGNRVVDMRIGQESPGVYYMSHNKWPTTYTLEGTLNEIKQFIGETKKEVVILDFHMFSILIDQEGDFDFDQLKEQVKSSLESFYIPPKQGQGKTLADIWASQQSPKQRIIISWNDESIDTSYMWPAVDQHWYSTASTRPLLYSALQSNFYGPAPADGLMWSTCVFTTVDVVNTPHRNAKDAMPDIDNWFNGCSDWTLKANIVSTDFFNSYNNVVQGCICASLIKAARK
jgi:hypothetical protein